MKFPSCFCPVKLESSGLRLPLSQASVNPKAEGVEELQTRRKRLHMGMCKLALEDLMRLVKQKDDAFKVPRIRLHPAAGTGVVLLLLQGGAFEHL